jgi:hypothetical protein
LERQAKGNIASDYGLHLAYPTVAVKSNGAALVGYVYSADLTIADFENADTQVPTYPGRRGGREGKSKRELCEGGCALTSSVRYRKAPFK